MEAIRCLTMSYVTL